MIELRDKESGARIGTISEEQLGELIHELEEEAGGDRDYWVDEGTLDMMADVGADRALVDMLRAALAGRDGMEIEWARV